MAAFSTLLGSSNALVAAFRGKNFSLDLHTISLGMPPSTWKRRTRAKAIDAVPTASLESMIDPAASLSLFPLCRDQPAIAAAAAAAVLHCRRTEEDKDEERRKEYVNLTAEKMDQWIKESIGEIVRNISEAPFLVQIFSQGSSVLRLERDEASPERWPLIKKKWNQTSCIPEGIILVEELRDNEEEDAANDNNGNGSESQTWGLVVQGRGMECAAPCYILNTCRVMSAAGFCTHFCLVRARCFGETLDKQLSRAWLQGR